MRITWNKISDWLPDGEAGKKGSKGERVSEGEGEKDVGWMRVPSGWGEESKKAEKKKNDGIVTEIH